MCLRLLLTTAATKYLSMRAAGLDYISFKQFAYAYMNRYDGIDTINAITDSDLYWYAIPCSNDGLQGKHQ
jgi:hypothetical protein